MNNDLIFNSQNARDYFKMQYQYHHDIKEQRFKKDNEGRDRFDTIYSAEYQKYFGMELAYQEVLEYFDKFNLSAKTPCDLCMYDPPSSFGGKLCSMCPARAKMGGRGRMKKYELTNEKKEFLGTTLYRIRALKNFELSDGTIIHAGDLGGWIEKEYNLSQEGFAWVSGNARYDIWPGWKQA